MIVRVRLDKYGALTEIDWKGAERAALAISDYINSADELERFRFAYDVKIMTIVRNIFNRKLVIPFPTRCEPYNYRSQREGWEPALPEAIADLYAELIARITGSPSVSSLSTHETGRYVFGKYREQDADGSFWEMCWFQD